MDSSDPLLSDLCSICHVNPPKYRCPRCSTRTCSLPCTKRHKLWSQCSGVRDPAAYLRRSELSTETAFDRDFNFITGIERSLERADRDAENRGIDLARGQDKEDGEEGDIQGSGLSRKRKHPQQGLVKGEAGFLRGAESGQVNVIRAPRGMTRNKQNGSRWHPKHKCLSWTIEWISPTGEKTLHNCLETCSITEAYDRAFPPPRHERVNLINPTQDEEGGKPEMGEKGEGSETNEDAPSKEESTDRSTVHPTDTGTEESTEAQPIESASSSAAGRAPEEAPEEAPEAAGASSDSPLVPHRGLYFYLHRPRTMTKKPVLAPLPPSKTLTAALRTRTILEFPTIYILPDSADKLLAEKESSQFTLEEEFILTVGAEVADKSAKSEEMGPEDDALDSAGSSANLENVDEKKILEVLKQDLFEAE